MTDLQLPDNPYLLLTPGPLSTTKRVKAAMLKDWCTWDKEYNQLVQGIRAKLTKLASTEPGRYTAVLMQGSGTFSVESVIGSVVPDGGRLLVLVNGAYGKRVAQIAEVLRIDTTVLDLGETGYAEPAEVEAALAADPAITHVAFVHGETTTGMLNPLSELAQAVKRSGRILIVDAMSSFGGVEIDMAELDIDFLISSSNKCIQGVPGFGFIVANRERLERCKGVARSLSLDLFDQWDTMERQDGKWRFTSPTHVVRAFDEALRELEEEGGIAARQRRYTRNHQTLVEGMERLGFRTLLPKAMQSPIITSFYYPESEKFSFEAFYQLMKQEGFVLYPGKITAASTFRIGHIGDVRPEDMERLLEAVERNRFWL
ncbi:2-aminoethylphosphonate--pyruvate transaminase [Paenibacillus filicis]|uniref:2-aminoethylphosphonate--pyruvate transaminase n=1 Tax=Paenibacillus gyeongsangnamensis TaxID=3388067 RepID=A0ABT4QG69_9BACL|nr:2-aminoethylphosphonate--pyruvate transaminase [Paenibacillus filicis]MCZ8515736.1 2-aminoethylphosphonate--pyruvate transaminase [Paenibacillus filicis]